MGGRKALSIYSSSNARRRGYAKWDRPEELKFLIGRFTLNNFKHELDLFCEYSVMAS
jgi:hypothetical protein